MLLAARCHNSIEYLGTVLYTFFMSAITFRLVTKDDLERSLKELEYRFTHSPRQYDRGGDWGDRYVSRIVMIACHWLLLLQPHLTRSLPRLPHSSHSQSSDPLRDWLVFPRRAL
jgi:hypothetical protein